MKVTIIGFWGGFPAANEATTGYLFEHDGFRLLVDCGSAVLSQLQRYVSIEELDAVILSHYHHDHFADIGPLQYARLIAKVLGKTNKELPIYGHPFDVENFKKLTYKDITKGVAYNPSEEITIGPFLIQFLKTLHPVDCFAMRITANGQSVVFTADTSFSENFIPFAMDADLLLSECNLYNNQDGSKMGHLTSTDAGIIASKANINELVLSHLPHFGNHQDLVTQAAAVYNGKIHLAYSGLIWERN